MNGKPKRATIDFDRESGGASASCRALAEEPRSPGEQGELVVKIGQRTAV